MFTITNANDTHLLAEAETLEQARFAARTMFEEGEPLPIHIFAPDKPDHALERLASGPHGVEIRSSDLSRRYR